MRRGSFECRLSVLLSAGMTSLVIAGAPEGQEPAATTAPAGDEASVEQLEQRFADYLHLANMGRFDAADSLATDLLQHPELNPLSDKGVSTLIKLTKQYDRSMETLLIVINNSSIGANAKTILDLIREAHRRERMRPERVLENIHRLNGSPTERAFGLDQLRESGEYAVPWMLKALADVQEEALHPYLVRALPALGKRAVNPLIAALEVEEEIVRLSAADALGKIGYPQALPYLQRIASDSQASDSAHKAAEAAIAQIVVENPAVKRKPADVLFRELAEAYYEGVETLLPDPREEEANVWYVRRAAELRDIPIEPVAVPRRIYADVMCMRTCRDGLALDAGQPEVQALWLAANFRREAALGLDVQSEETAVSGDPTRPENFPRSIYFARISGPRYSRLALRRAIKDLDRNVALGAIAALRRTAGPASMVEAAAEDGMSLSAALRFPDLLVRTRAALALGEAMPRDSFPGADEVVPTLASALSLTGKKFYMLVDPDDAKRAPFAEALTAAGAEVIADGRLTPALERAQRERSHLDGIFLASDVRSPSAIEAIQGLGRDARFGLAPIVLIVKRGDNLIMDQAAVLDARVGTVFDVAEAGVADPELVRHVMEKLERTAALYGAAGMTGEESVQLALSAAQTLLGIAEGRSAVFDVRAAEAALIDALGHPSETLRLAAARVLAWVETDSAQGAVARFALDGEQQKGLRIEAFGALADSARRFGHRLDGVTTQKLIDEATGQADLDLRTAASQAAGAMNLPGDLAAQVILKQPER